MFSGWFKGVAMAAGLAAGLTGGSLQLAVAHAQDMGDDSASQNGYPDNGYYPNDGTQQDEANASYPAQDDGYAQDNGAQDGYDNGGGTTDVATFDAALSPYGSWQDTQTYGRVWRPDPYVVGADFVPYGSGGQWVYTDYGWSWQSDWAWGWAPFHYGRWALDAVFGWVWLPGSVWAPAWVDWRYGSGYVGWCPLGPAGYSWQSYGWYHHPYWNFVNTQYFVQPNPIHYAVPVHQVHTVMAATQPLHNTVGFHGAHWYGGPPPGHIATATGHAITPVGVRPPPPGHIAVVRPGFTNQTPPSGFHGQSTASGFRGPYGGYSQSRPPGTSVFTRPVTPYHGSMGTSGFSSHPSTVYGSGITSRPPPASGFSSPHGFGGSTPPPAGYSGSMGYGGSHAAPPGGGFHTPMTSGGFHSAPSSGFHGAPSGGGGFHAAPPSGGGGGGFHSAPPAPHFSGGGGGGGHASPPAGFHSGGRH